LRLSVSLSRDSRTNSCTCQGEREERGYETRFGKDEALYNKGIGIKHLPLEGKLTTKYQVIYSYEAEVGENKIKIEYACLIHDLY